jgi:hypothetical protein
MKICGKEVNSQEKKIFFLYRMNAQLDMKEWTDMGLIML